MENSSGELWRNRMHRVVIHLCSPLLCQTSWLQRQLLKDGIILITIFVGIVSVQHQVLTISLSHGIVTMPELVYRMLVTLLYVSKQWGSNNPSPITYPISFTKTVFTVLPILQTADGGNMSKNRLYVTSLTVNGFTIYNPQNSYNWLAVGR